MNKNKKGFTLIELLITIAILAIVLVIGFVSYTIWAGNSKNKRDEISFESIKKVIYVYTDELRQSDQYWFKSDANDELEYSCLTVGSLINNGYLKDNIIGTNYDNKVISKDTSIKIWRNSLTKAYNKNEFDIDSEDCKVDSNIIINLSIIEGDKSQIKDDWYVSTVKVKADIENYNQAPVDGYHYVLSYKDKYNKDKQKELSYVEQSDLSNMDKSEIFNIDTNGSSLKFCISATNYKDITNEFCIDNINIDSTPPDISNLNLNINNGVISSTGATDNLTSDSNIVYELSGDAVVDNNKINVSNLTNRVSSRGINVKVIDAVGNYSTNSSYKIDLFKTTEGTVTSATIYSCSLNNKTYTSEPSTSECSIPGTPAGTVTSSSDKSCDYGDTLVGNTCYDYNDTVAPSYIWGCTGKNEKQEGNNCVTETTTTDTKYVDGYCLCARDKNVSYFKPWEESCTDNSSVYKNQGYSCSVTSKANYQTVCTSESMIGTHLDYTATCTKSETTTSTSSTKIVGTSCAIGYRLSEGSCVRTYSPIKTTKYYCNGIEKKDEDDARNACKKTETVWGTISSSTKYYCSLTRIYYDKKSEADSACLGSCSTGYKSYSGSCYKLGKG